MKGRALTAILMLFMLAVICLVSVPVYSGEHPWDRDDPGDGKDSVIVDTMPDSTIVDGGTSADWWLFLYQTSIYLVLGTVSVTAG